MAFGSITDIYRALVPLSVLDDPIVGEAMATLRATFRQRLGFFGNTSQTDAIETAIRVLQEQGQATTTEERLKIVDALKQLDQQRQLRMRVVLQIVITVLVIILALAVILGWVKASDDLKKAGYGLVGTVVGYWLK